MGLGKKRGPPKGHQILMTDSDCQIVSISNDNVKISQQLIDWVDGKLEGSFLDNLNNEDLITLAEDKRIKQLLDKPCLNPLIENLTTITECNNNRNTIDDPLLNILKNRLNNLHIKDINWKFIEVTADEIESWPPTHFQEKVWKQEKQILINCEDDFKRLAEEERQRHLRDMRIRSIANWFKPLLPKPKQDEALMMPGPPINDMLKRAIHQKLHDNQLIAYSFKPRKILPKLTNPDDSVLTKHTTCNDVHPPEGNLSHEGAQLGSTKNTKISAKSGKLKAKSSKLPKQSSKRGRPKTGTTSKIDYTHRDARGAHRSCQRLIDQLKMDNEGTVNFRVKTS